MTKSDAQLDALLIALAATPYSDRGSRDAILHAMEAAASVDGRRKAETENTGSVPQGTTSAVPSEASADAHPSAPSLQTPQGGDS